ncbi:MAG: heme o synthase, partial [Limisphaera sp.]|nr:heme o synthase [Limisphaera sp.]
EDGRMPRTQHRPLPSGWMQPRTAFGVGTGLAAVGLGYLAWTCNGLSALLGAVTLGSYLLLYTPLKRRVWWNTWVGAIPGALPPVIGWAAARGSLDAGAWALFGIVACWQMPHFFGIAWMYRDDYARAGFRMLPQFDPTGIRTGRQAVGWTLLLLPVSGLPWYLGLTGDLYLGAAAVLGLAYLGAALQLARQRTDRAARRLFLASILYLPVLLVFLVLDKVRWTP